MRLALLSLPVLLALACGGDGGGNSIDQKLEAWCERCGFYPDMATCMEVQRRTLDCTNCPEAYADQVQCYTDNDCQPGPHECAVLPHGCIVGNSIVGRCPD